MIEVRIEVTDEHVSRGGQPSAAQRIWQAVEQVKEDLDAADDSTVISTRSRAPTGARLLFC